MTTAVKKLLLALTLPLVALQACSGPTSDRSATAPGWEQDRRLTSSPGESLLSFNFAWSVAADDRGMVHVVWYDNRGGNSQVYYKRSTDGGTTWEPDLRLSTDPASREHPAIAVWSGNVYVVWHDTRGANLKIYFVRSTDSGNTWEPEIPLTTSGASAHSSIAATGTHVHVVYGDTREGHAEIYTRRSTDGGKTWEPEMRISATPFESWVPTVAVSGENVYVAWVDYRDGNEEEYIRRSTDGGATWEPVTRLTENSADSWAPSIAVAGNSVHVVWFDRRDAGITHFDVESGLDESMKLVGLPAEPAPPPDPSIYYLPPFTQRVQDKLQKIQAAAPGWVQRGGDPKELEAMLREFEQMMQAWTSGWEIYYKRSQDRGVTWGPDTRLTNAPDVSARPSIAVAGTDLHIVWYDRRDGNLEVYYKRSTDGGDTWGPDTRLTYAPDDSLHPTVAVSDNAVHVVWYDRRDGNAEIYYKRQVR